MRRDSESEALPQRNGTTVHVFRFRYVLLCRLVVWLVVCCLRKRRNNDHRPHNVDAQFTVDAVVVGARRDEQVEQRIAQIAVAPNRIFFQQKN